MNTVASNIIDKKMQQIHHSKTTLLEAFHCIDKHGMKYLLRVLRNKN